MTALASSAHLARRPWRYISRAEIFIIGYFSVFFLAAFTLPTFVFFIYTPVAVAFAAILLFVAEDGYLEFGWWLWFLTPCLRRIVDLSIGYTSASPIMLAPLLVTMLCAIRLLSRFSNVPPIQFLAFGGISLSLLYGFLIGAINAGLAAAAYGLADWATPVILCWYLAARPEKYQNFSAVTRRSFLIGSLLMGIYGIYQFFYLPSWDAYWMVSAELVSQGDPLPMLVRVFGTLNSSLPYAIALMAGLLFIAAQARTLAWLAAVPALIGFLLSLVRTSWIGLAVGLIVLMIRAPAKRQFQLILGVGIIILLTLPILSNDTISKLVFDRFQTFFTLEEDASYQSRSDFYTQARDKLLSNFVGTGIGSNGTAAMLADQDEESTEFFVYDSGLMAIPFTLGIPGAVFFFSGFLSLCFVAFFSARTPNDSTAIAALAVLAGILIQAIGGNVFNGVSAIILWGMLGLLLSARQFHRVHGASFPGAT